MPKLKCLMIGAGGMAGSWINWFCNDCDDRVDIVGIAEVVPEVLEKQGSILGLPNSHLFSNALEAIEKTDADFVGVATPPQFHREAVVAALDRGLPVICEKPIADTLKSALAVVQAAKRSGLPCTIIQNYRYARNKLEVVRMREAGELGRIQHILGRYACDYRKYGSWGKDWRHDMDFSLLFEGSVHHFDMMRFLSGGDCERLTGFGWNPEWSSFRHHSSGMYLMRMSNGVHAFYEGNSSAAGITNCWYKEYYRIEFEMGTVEIAEGDTVTVHRVGQELEAHEAPEIPRFGHVHLFNEFIDWLDGGPPSVTRVEDNINSFAMVIAAMETTLDGQPERIADYLTS